MRIDNSIIRLVLFVFSCWGTFHPYFPLLVFIVALFFSCWIVRYSVANILALLLFLPIFGLSTCAAYLSGEANVFYLFNEGRYLLVIIIGTFVMGGNSIGKERYGTLVILMFVFLGLSRGAGFVMPIYLGALFFLLYSPLLYKTSLMLSPVTGSFTSGLAFLSDYALKKVKNGRVVSLILGGCMIVGLLVFNQIYFRGRELDFESIDRFQLYIVFWGLLHSFSLPEWLFGVGPGINLLSKVQGYEFSVVAWLVAKFSDHGFYSYMFHSEHIRLFLNFGLIGYLVYWLVIYFQFGLRFFVFFFVFGLFNSILTVPSVLLCLLYFVMVSKQR